MDKLSKISVIFFSFFLLIIGYVLLVPPTFASHCDGLDLSTPEGATECANRVGSPPKTYCDNTSPQSAIWKNGSIDSTAQHTFVVDCPIGDTCTQANGVAQCVPKGDVGSECEYTETHSDGNYTCRGL